ncbi:MAG: FAD-binding oxidoreductase, partial [Candidatus Korarchaeota archaeon]|nr:FAD-binding oxidoreductase [Candidatus Korarchaeota archaeon]NIU82060.1 FAD-binding protein [Candidatus Thorarchaeota archaeon]NIW12480.1 FAD-binding protein [Candidatus Thorarchaeota archaeon]NIW50694.1 FAD-binding protein [Candidatus Korarchaeota archaeon]
MNNLNPLVIKKLQKICGSEYMVTDENLMIRYTTDETKALEKKVELRFPAVVVKPETPQQVSEILNLTSKEEIPVTPRGGGTGESGGAVPIHGGIVLSLERLDNIIEIDT